MFLPDAPCLSSHLQNTMILDAFARGPLICETALWGEYVYSHRKLPSCEVTNYCVLRTVLLFDCVRMSPMDVSVFDYNNQMFTHICCLGGILCQLEDS